jgi:hypothetical protein
MLSALPNNEVTRIKNGVVSINTYQIFLEKEIAFSRRFRKFIKLNLIYKYLIMNVRNTSTQQVLARPVG